MIFKLLVGIEWLLFVCTALILTILLVVLKKMKRTQFIRLLSFPGFKNKGLTEIKADLLKVEGVLLRVRVEAIITSVIAIISLIVIWFLVNKDIARSVTILMGISIIVQVLVVILLLEYCVHKMSRRADELIEEGE